ncbi:hypothetical protein QJQ45_003540 [Haematococcus lacustris]|nr:hypothetical protein QJQ45_003540 [Haematococcus lacustris]
MANPLLLPVDNRSCDVGMGSFAKRSFYTDQGYLIASHTVHTGSSILFRQESSVDMFMFIRPFDSGVWLLMFATSVFIGIAVLLAEAMQQFNAKSTGARVIVLGYGFLVLVLVNMYIAVLASQLTINSTTFSITGPQDLAGQPVGIWEGDNATLLTLLAHTKVVQVPWSFAEDEANIVSMVRTGKVAAFVIDSAFAKYHAATSCDLYVVDEPVQRVDAGYAFGTDTDLAYVDAWRQALLVMQQTGVKESLRLTYLEPSNPCANKDTSTLTTSNITVAKASVAGLWLFLGAAIGAGYLWNTASWLRERQRPASSIPGVVGHNKHGNANAVAPSGLSATPALDSLAKPSVTWLGVGDASTTEEGMEVLERQVKAMDARMKSMLEAIDQRLERISSSLPVLDESATSHRTTRCLDATIIAQINPPDAAALQTSAPLKSVRVSLPPDTPALYPCGSGAEGVVGTGTPADTTQQQASQAPLAAIDVLQPAIQPTPPAWRPEPRQPSPRAPAAAGAVLCAGVGEGVQGAGSRAVPAVDAVKDFHED